MGVYHLMGLGRSVGVVTGPLSYLAHRYNRWDLRDRAFFSQSGEFKQRQAGERVGDVQALILFTTKEVIEGRYEATGKECFPHPYIANPPGVLSAGETTPDAPMKQCLERFLKKIWPDIGGGRREGTIFWCEVDRRDSRCCFERIARIMTALSRKEQWVNLTGGNNVVNSALQLAASLSGEVARLYYVQAEDERAERCIYYTTERDYWVDLPIMPLALSRLSQAILDSLQHRSMNLGELYSHLINHRDHAGLVWNIAPEIMLETYLRPLWKQRLISGASERTGPYTLGEQWEFIRPYRETLERARRSDVTLEQLAQQEPWLTQQLISLT